MVKHSTQRSESELRAVFLRSGHHKKQVLEIREKTVQDDLAEGAAGVIRTEWAHFAIKWNSGLKIMRQG
jgi:hypothetical protein